MIAPISEAPRGAVAKLAEFDGPRKKLRVDLCEYLGTAYVQITCDQRDGGGWHRRAITIPLAAADEIARGIACANDADLARRRE